LILNVDYIKKLKLTKEQIKLIAPHATDGNIVKHLDGLNMALNDCKIDTPLKQAHFLAQLMHESGGLQFTSELGVTEDAYDGFKGRGLIQLTYQENYESYGIFVGEDFTSSLGNKKKLEEPPHAAKSAGWFWSEKSGLNPDAQNSDFIYITFAINGGFNGYNDRLKYLKNGLIALCPHEHISTEHLFSQSKVYNNIKGAFGWGLWHDSATNKEGCTKSVEKALEGYNRFIELHNSQGSPAIIKKWYGYVGNTIRNFVEGRIKAF
jgi:predicted chitinase